MEAPPPPPPAYQPTPAQRIDTEDLRRRQEELDRKAAELQVGALARIELLLVLGACDIYLDPNSEILCEMRFFSNANKSCSGSKTWLRAAAA